MEDEVDIPEGTVAYGNSSAHEAALRYHEGPLTFATDPTRGERVYLIEGVAVHPYSLMVTQKGLVERELKVTLAQLWSELVGRAQ